MASPAAERLESPVQYLKGVGPKRSSELARLDIASVQDLLLHYPRAWEDRRETAAEAVSSLQGPVVIRGRVARARMIPTKGALTLFKASVNVPAWGGVVEAVWFKRVQRRFDVFQKIRKDVAPGADLWIVGRAEPALLPQKEISVEEYYPVDDPRAGIHVGRLTPVYPLTEGLSQRFLRELIAGVLPAAEDMPEIIPPETLRRRSLLAVSQALRGIHFPKSKAELEEARRRLSYEELLLLGLAWTLKRDQVKSVSKGYSYEIRRTLLTPFKERLGFDMTSAQKRVINEIFEDMQSPRPMTRLLQGDVGSGKTAAAAAALLLAAENGFQGAFMAPTEILAEQHFWTLSEILRGLPVKMDLLTSRVSPAGRRRVLEALASGETGIVVGTHAILEGDVRFARLRLAVIDEQHRFGVRQRTTLRGKGPPMDLLLMTATPIPRTLALSLYGDLDVSTLDEMPPGRSPVATFQGTEEEALKRVRSEAAAGRQAYIVYPVISESSRLDLKAAKAEHERLRAGPLAGLRVALIHGQMAGRRKAQVMEAFLRKEWDVLVATPVIEVGMDVPNATVMVVQNADRFGLASLHQLRGRVGRSPLSSQCWLVSGAATPEASRRLEVLCETSDGFKISEEDLRLRGPGEMIGMAQHGELSLRAADLARDADLLEVARLDARGIIEKDPRLSAPENRLLRQRLIQLYQRHWRVIDLA